jgi:hypothetical protein
MSSLAGLLLSVIATLGLYVAVVRKRRWSPTFEFSQVCFVALCAICLLLALRFGARTYPGVWVPGSKLLNWVINGTGLFTLGYGMVVAAMTIYVAAVLVKPSGQTGRLLQTSCICLTALATSISLYGLVWAAALQRLCVSGALTDELPLRLAEVSSVRARCPPVWQFS